MKRRGCRRESRRCAHATPRPPAAARRGFSPVHPPYTAPGCASSRGHCPRRRRRGCSRRFAWGGACAVPLLPPGVTSIKERPISTSCVRASRQCGPHADSWGNRSQCGPPCGATGPRSVACTTRREAIARQVAGLVDESRGARPAAIVEHRVVQRRQGALKRVLVAHGDSAFLRATPGDGRHGSARRAQCPPSASVSSLAPSPPTARPPALGEGDGPGYPYRCS